MSFKINDIVSVIDDDLKGKITSIFQHHITIETSDGFKFNYPKNELVKITSKLDESIQNQTSLINKDHIVKSTKPILVKDSSKQQALEVDLHIHHLTSKNKGLKNFDMLQIQLETAKNKMNYAIENRIPKVIFIHGVGEGVLKQELLQLLKEYNVDMYDASYKKYGRGATEVYIYQNT